MDCIVITRRERQILDYLQQGLDDKRDRAKVVYQPSYGKPSYPQPVLEMAGKKQCAFAGEISEIRTCTGKSSGIDPA